ncbi:unnamed protein product [Strongylus vulgaris]|uniref:Uncharacterized protein n=1 Tax=Strongylus vulgaris TaxID=40348 RepID=A0A3P7HZJ1_STRVU|nr:unnamed protein product [Strongylus vulgaris]
MRDGTLLRDTIRALDEPSTCGSVCDSDSVIAISEDGGLDLVCEEESSNSATLSSNRANPDEPELSIPTRSRSQSPNRSVSRKPKRDIFLIRSRTSGRAGNHILQEGCFVCGGNAGDLLHCGKKYTPGAFCSTTFHKECIEVAFFLL